MSAVCILTISSKKLSYLFYSQGRFYNFHHCQLLVKHFLPLLSIVTFDQHHKNHLFPKFQLIWLKNLFHWFSTESFASNRENKQTRQEKRDCIALSARSELCWKFQVSLVHWKLFYIRFQICPYRQKRKRLNKNMVKYILFVSLIYNRICLQLFQPNIIIVLF